MSPILNKMTQLWSIPCPQESALCPVSRDNRRRVLLLQGVLESFVGTALTGAVFCLLAGQPLTILSSTGPVLVFERLLFNFSK